MSELQPGTLLQERYLVGERIAAGDVAVVYRAQDIRLFKRPVVLKVLRTGSEEARFRQELRALASIKHPNVAAVHDWAEVNGRPVAVYELIDDDLVPLQRVARPAGMPAIRVAHLSRTLGDALAAIHSQGIVHRDINPRNILIRDAGGSHETPIIFDFGRAALIGEQAEYFVPPMPYVAPEQSRAHQASIAGDLFAFAGVLFFALTGHDPAPEISLGAKLPTEAWPAHVSAAARAKLRRAFSVDPNARYPDARQLGDEVADSLRLGNFAAGTPPRSLRVFLCHASIDKPKVRELYQLLIAHQIDAWLDEAKLLPGQEWESEIIRAVRSSDVIIACLSAGSITREGFVQKELRWALDVADEKPEGTIFLIPARLEPCDVPRKLQSRQWIDLYSEGGIQNLLRSLRVRAHSPTLR
ncbi:MAG: TIR domain-containing protein [Longimicrobiaceae bacterium]